MTDHWVLIVEDGAGIDKCPECGSYKFRVKGEFTVQVDTQTDESFLERSEEQEVSCNNCGETWSVG